MRLPSSALGVHDRAAVLRHAVIDRTAERLRQVAVGRPDAAGEPPPTMTELSTAVAAASAGGRPTGEDLDRLRAMAVRGRHRDCDGTAITALSILADRFGDSGAQAWLGPALAEAGRFDAAVARGAVFGPGRPRADHYPIMVTALDRLGNADEAAALARSLDRRFPALRRAFTHIWADDPVGQAYRRLVQDSPGRPATAGGREQLPVFQHLPFCAGSSMQFGLRQVVPLGRTLQIGRRSGLREIAAIHTMPADELNALMLVHQHHPYALQVPGRRLRHFTVLRDPVSQLRSGFYKRTARAQIVSTRDRRSATFDQHADYLLAAGMTNQLTRMLITTHPELRTAFRRRFDRPSRFRTIRNEEDMFWLRSTRRFSDQKLLRLAHETLSENFAVVGTMAELQASHLACTAAVGVPYAALLGHRGRSGQPRSNDDSATDRRLRDANAVDQELYETYTARFITEHAELITAVRASAAADPASSSGQHAPADTSR